VRSQGSRRELLHRAVVELRRLQVHEVDRVAGRSRLYEAGDETAWARMLFDLDRFGDFMELLPASTKALRILDLGANPYILTYALARAGFDVVAGGHPRPDGQAGVDEVVEFVDPGRGCVRAVPLVRFNVEQDDFPFGDGEFDVVVCGELIEHLPNGPDKMLFECNRVLKHGGVLLISTPNALAMTRILALLRGVNGETRFSSQGVYDRHNRLYSMAEMLDLLAGNNFQARLAKGSMFSHRRDWYAPGPLGLIKWAAVRSVREVIANTRRPSRRLADGLLLAGVKSGPPGRYRPDWLFRADDSIPVVADRQASDARA
jgi:2-polyprenyl-3-methyl-5-hydroxy-6-metoxy-1,4-benzoquinol methylase